jgi:CheY-like chemotaxis protein
MRLRRRGCAALKEYGSFSALQFPLSIAGILTAQLLSGAPLVSFHLSPSHHEAPQGSADCWGAARVEGLFMSSPGASLSFCSAVVVGHQGDSRNLVQLARKVGFGSVQELNEAPNIKRPEFALTYFLINHQLSDETKSRLVRRLRRSPASKIRYAPIVAIGGDVEFEVVMRHIEMGFDDFVCLPEKVEIVAHRLINQLGQPQVYIETATYFGPDRRRMEVPGPVNTQRKPHPHSHTRITLRRSVEYGIELLQQEVFI